MNLQERLMMDPPTWRVGESSVERGFRMRHNACITEYAKARLGCLVTLSSGEERALLIAWTIQEFVSLYRDEYESVDPYAANELLSPMLRAFIAHLNFDVGRLNCGFLDAWAHEVAASCGMDVDLLEVV